MILFRTGSRLSSIFFFGFFVCFIACSKDNDPSDPVLAIFDFHPKSGIAGDLIVLTGSQFNPDMFQNKVYFNGIEAPVIEAYDNSLVVKVPGNSNCTGYITVSTANNTVQTTDKFTYLVPEITGLLPAFGRAGDTLHIVGNFFCPDPNANEVTLNGIKVQVVGSTENEILVIVPKDRNSTGAVKLTTCNLSISAKGPFTYQLSPIKVVTIAGSFQEGFKDGRGTDALFHSPNDLVLDENGYIYLTDSWNNSIRKIGPDGMVTTVAGNGLIGAKDGPGAMAQFWMPFGITLDGKGNIFVTDWENSAIRKIDKNGNVSTLAKNNLGNPADVVVEGDIMYISDPLNNKIYLIDAQNNFSVFAGSGDFGFLNGIGIAAIFYQPIGLAVDQQHRLFVADHINNRIRVISAAGNVESFAGDGAPSWTDGKIPDVGFDKPFGIAVDYIGNIYISDFGHHTIRRISPDGIVVTIAGDGTPGYQDDIPSKSKFNNPSGVATDKEGHVYVADRRNNCIRKIIME